MLAQDVLDDAARRHGIQRVAVSQRAVLQHQRELDPIEAAAVGEPLERLLVVAHRRGAVRLDHRPGDRLRPVVEALEAVAVENRESTLQWRTSRM